MEAKNLNFSYDNDKSEFIKDLDVAIEKGKITTILGPNGSGKSTLLNLFIKQLLPNKGEIYLDKAPISKIKQKEIAKKISVVHQNNSAPGDLTVEDLVSYGRVPHQSFWQNKSDEDQEYIDDALKMTNLYNLKYKYVTELSGGERQRAWIALALAQKTDILFLDEPTTYLDISYQMEILNLISELNEKYNITIIMVLHDINQAIKYSHNLIILKEGKLVYEGDTDHGITKEILKEVYGIDAVISYCPINHCKRIIPIVNRKEKAV